MRTGIVNVCFISVGDRWVLVDTGIPGYRGAILREAERRYGRRARPAAIVLTHGHFDQIGSVKALADYWSVPVYAHRLELPYLTGASSYRRPTLPLAAARWRGCHRCSPRVRSTSARALWNCRSAG